MTSLSLLLLCLAAGARTPVGATVLRDRAAFEAAAQNLNTIDFEGEHAPAPYPGPVIDGVAFEGTFGPTGVTNSPNTSNQVLRAGGVGEITSLLIRLPPGTTAVGFDQFSRPFEVSTSTGEKVTVGASDASPFVGFVSDTPIESLYILIDFPEPTDDIIIDDLSFGQRRAGNDPPAPILLVNASTGRAAALDSVTSLSEPFDVASAHNLSADGRTRVTLFLVGVRFDDPGDVQLVTARAEDSAQRAFDLPVEAVGRVKNLSWMAQVTVRLPDALGGAGDVSVSVSVRGARSNKATLRVGTPAN